MMKRLPILLAMLVLAVRAEAAITSASVDRAGAVTELRLGLDAPATRLHLSAHGDQLWIDLDGTGLKLKALPPIGREAAPIKRVRATSPDGIHTRIIVEVAGKANYSIVQHDDAIALRFAPAGAVANLKVAPEHHAVVAEPRSTMRNTMDIARAVPIAIHPPPSREAPIERASGSPLVMIDPGHGGYDPGTQSSSGIVEKDVALDISRKLVEALKARGIRTQMTRDSDDFIALSERTRRANLANADLFVSIHLNSSPNPQTTGIEVYYLNNTTDRATIRLARMENVGVTGTSAPRDSNLNYILADLRQNYKANEAASLARMIDTQTVSDLDTHLGLQVNPLGAKMGPFYVLVGAHMPAVLVECGFLSSAYEAQQLASAQYQETLAQGIASAVASYLNADASAGNL